MIAHRLQTIQTAQHLVYLENKHTQIEAEKGSEAYEKIMDKLQRENYAHQKKEDESNEEEDSDIDEKAANAEIINENFATERNE